MTFKQLKAFLVVMFSAIIIIIIAFACSSDKEESPIPLDTLNSRILKTENQFEDLFTFPIGTELWVEDNSLQFKLPKGYLLILKSENSDSYQIERISEGSVRCKCLEGSGCSPYTVGSQSGCSTDNNSCKKCEMTTSSTNITSAKNQNGFIFVDAEIVNLNEDSEFLVDASDILGAKSPKGFIFDAPEVQAKLFDFMSGYSNEDDDKVLSKKDTKKLPEDYKYTPIRFLGKLVFIPLNKKKSISARIVEDYISDGSHSCTCHSGSGCKKGSTWTPKGTIRYCDAGNCSDCELE